MRCFVALELPGDVRDALAAWTRAAAAGERALRPIGAEALHVTLAFLGERDAADIPALSEAVRCAAGPGRTEVGALSTGAVLWLAPRHPHVLTVAVDDGDGALERLHGAVWERLEALGHRREHREWRPHVTVARVRHGALPARLELPPPPRLDFAGEALTLFRSHLSSGPARYEALARASLHPA